MMTMRGDNFDRANAGTLLPSDMTHLYAPERSQ
jgi:hypothetical protein